MEQHSAVDDEPEDTELDQVNDRIGWEDIWDFVAIQVRNLMFDIAVEQAFELLRDIFIS